jgi:hypothetical protein
MSPVLRDIKKAFEKRRQLNEESVSLGSICELHAFYYHDYWMYNYLFPETLLVADDYREQELGWAPPIFVFPCNVCSEDQVLRIMSEHNLL